MSNLLSKENLEYAINYFERQLKEDSMQYGERQAIHIALASLLAGPEIKVSDLDPLMPTYHVVDETGWTIGEKRRTFGYLKGTYAKNGRKVGGKHAGIAERAYHSSPPWLKYVVFKIDTLGGFTTLHTRKEVDHGTNL